MSKLSILDIIALSKAGYKKSDIDEILKVDIPENTPSEPATPENSGDKSDEPASENTQNASVQDSKGTDDQSDNIDYKSAYELLKTESEKLKDDINRLRSELTDAQKENTTKPMNDASATPDSNEDIINKAFLNLM